MSKRFRIAKRISMEDIDHFEDIEVDDDFVDNEMVQIIADNEYDPMYDDCESIAVALQLAGYGKVADLEAKLAEKESEVKVGEFWHSAYQGKQLDYDKVYAELRQSYDENEKLKQQLSGKEKELNDWKDGTIICKWTDAENKVKELEHQIAEKEELIMFADRTIKGLVLAKEIDKISFAVDILEELADCSNYINSKLDFESGSYVSEKSIRDKIKYLKGNKYE